MNIDEDMVKSRLRLWLGQNMTADEGKVLGPGQIKVQALLVGFQANVEEGVVMNIGEVKGRSRLGQG